AFGAEPLRLGANAARSIEGSMSRPASSTVRYLPMASYDSSESPKGSNPPWQPLHGDVVLRNCALSRSVIVWLACCSAILACVAGSDGGEMSGRQRSEPRTNSPRKMTEVVLGADLIDKSPAWVRMPARSPRGRSTGRKSFRPAAPGYATP